MMPVVAALAGLAAALSGCSPETGDAPGAADDSLELYYDQDLAWGSCDEFATTDSEAETIAAVAAMQCARLAVPLDYEDPDGAEASVAVSRIPARGEPMGSLVTNPGGPGGSGVIGAVQIAAGLVESRITERFDVVGFDPRGVGATEPAVQCYSDAEADTASVAMGPAGTTEQITADDARELFERCAEGSGGAEALTSTGTRDTARDMDVLRAALGEEQLTFLGISYGTRLGAVYAEQFPDRVRAMLLDGGRDPRQGTMETRLSAYSGFQAAFNAMAAQCAERADCPLGQDPTVATKRFQQIVQPLGDEPVPALEAQLDFDAAVGGVIAGLYTPEAWAGVIDGIIEVTQGRGDTLLRLSYLFGGRSESGQWPNTDSANYAINCMDEERLTPEQGAELREATFEMAPFMDPGVDVDGISHDGCEAWPAEPTLGFPYGQDIEGLAPVMVVSLTDDPTTPYDGALSLADSLSATLLTVEGQGHTIVSGGQNACVDDAAAAYLIDLELPPEGATCATG